jgi:bifunctional NMN adenylyltransferase/nudix hydrolase
MSKEYKYAVFIGRFQPFHKAHLEVAKFGLEIADNLIFVIGSANAARTIKNPFTEAERESMIQSAVDDEIPHSLSRLHFVSARDYHYSDNIWVTQVQNGLDSIIEHGDAVALIGNVKDASSYYIKYFPQYDFVPVRTKTPMMDASSIRDAVFDVDFREQWGNFGPTANADPPDISHLVPGPVNAFMKEFVHTHTYLNLLKDYKYLKEYKEKWDAAPFPPTFITADAMVTCSGHVLVVRRGFNPGKGLLALPGGFVRQDEKIKNAALRELKEETRIKIDKLVLHNAIVDDRVFDHPARSLRGRTVTHAYHIHLKDGRLPEVKGGDDAEKAFWLPFAEVYKRETEFFEDHFHMITYFLNQR